LESAARYRRATVSASKMKSLFLCLLMTSIVMASYPGPSVQQVRRLLLKR
jgi:hypothetical protein